MDWSKAKNILIIVFLILNIYLTVNIIIDRAEGKIKSETLLHAENILNERGVFLEEGVKLPSYNSPTPSLSLDNTGIDREKVSKFLVGTYEEELDEISVDGKTLKFLPDMTIEYINKNPEDYLQIDDKKQVEKYLRKFMSMMGLPVKDFVMDTYSSSTISGRATFTYNYKGFLVFDNYAEFQFNKKGVQVMNLRYLNVKGFDTKARGITPAHSILISNYDKPFHRIEKIDFGYISDTINAYEEGEVMEIESHSPVWRVKLKGRIGFDFYLAETGEKI